MTATKEGLNTVGVVTDRNHTDGKKLDGSPWNRYSFQINGHWYSSFADDVWKVLEKGKCFKVYYSEKENPKGGAPYRTVEWTEPVAMEPATAAQAQEAADKASAENQIRRSVQEMRWTEAINNATNLLAYASNLMFDQTTEQEILKWAGWYYQAIIAGPPCGVPAEAPTEAAEPPPPQEQPAAPAQPIATTGKEQRASFEALSRLNGARQAGLARHQWATEQESLSALEGFVKRNFQGRAVRQLNDPEVDMVTAAVREGKL